MPAAFPEVPALIRPIIRRFEQIGRALFADGIWTCDAGALVLAYLCRCENIACRLHVGLYYWPVERRAQHWSVVNDGEPTDEDLAGFWDDEHHHWVTIIDPRLNQPWLIDPNGEIRSEPRAMPLANAESRYRSTPSLSEWSGVSPETDRREAAEWIPEVARAIAMIGKKVVPAGWDNGGCGGRPESVDPRG